MDTAPTPRRWPRLVSLLCLACLWGVSLFLWPRLPAEIPLHFDIDGVPDRIGASSPLNWFLIPLIATVMTALLLGIAAWIPRLARAGSEWINLPMKKQYLALPPESRVAALAPLSWMLQGLPALTCVLFAWIVVGTYQVASGTAATLPFWPMIPLLLVLVGSVIRATLAVRRAIKAAVEKAGA